MLLPLSCWLTTAAAAASAQGHTASASSCCHLYWTCHHAQQLLQHPEFTPISPQLLGVVRLASSRGWKGLGQRAIELFNSLPTISQQEFVHGSSAAVSLAALLVADAAAEGQNSSLSLLLRFLDAQVVGGTVPQGSKVEGTALRVALHLSRMEWRSLVVLLLDLVNGYERHEAAEAAAAVTAMAQASSKHHQGVDGCVVTSAWLVQEVSMHGTALPVV